MEKNVGTLDRIIRIVIALAIFGAGFYFKSWFGLIGLIPLFTGVVGWCGLYVPFGINTCKIKK